MHEPHAEHCIDAAEGDAVAAIGDVVNVVEAQDVGGERAKMPGLQRMRLASSAKLPSRT